MWPSENENAIKSVVNKWSYKVEEKFMICCDICLDWFHGKCVGITKSKGKVCQKYRYHYMYYCALLGK